MKSDMELIEEIICSMAALALRAKLSGKDDGMAMLKEVFAEIESLAQIENYK